MLIFHAPAMDREVESWCQVWPPSKVLSTTPLPIITTTSGESAVTFVT